MKISVYADSFPLKNSFTISRGSKTTAETVCVTIETETATGWGECLPYKRYGETVDSVMREIRQAIPMIENGIQPNGLRKLMKHGAARNALDCALYDLICKQENLTIWEWLKIPKSETVQTVYTLGLDSPENMAEAVKNAPKAKIYKLKFGGGEQDLQRLQALRNSVSGDTKFIIDANEAWTVEDYQNLITHLQDCGVCLIEQPFRAGEDEILRDLPRPIPICADESFHIAADLPKMQGLYDAVNIKLDKAGGLTEALHIAQTAQDYGLKIMVGCMVSSSLSIAPAYCLAGFADWVDLDAPLLLAEDREHGFKVQDTELQCFTKDLWG